MYHLSILLLFPVAGENSES